MKSKPQSEVKVVEPPIDPNLQRMIDQVQVVLPHIPAAAIKNDIGERLSPSSGPTLRERDKCFI